MNEDFDPQTGVQIATVPGFDIVSLNLATLDEHVLLQWTPTLAQAVGALALARAKNLSAPAALDGYRTRLKAAEREQKIALGLALQTLRTEYGTGPTMTELREIAYGADDRLRRAVEAHDTAWLEYEYAKDFADAVARDVSILQSIVRRLGGEPS